ncbi:cytochrome P450 [Saccharopolyspora aridisoli]|uniref:Cytochrome P450 n=1 Tax=Saccharopolyspora aridisoli TaxID=2530385 RepID=A0A4R4UIC5_9PSEU|nr:cytochrome P450 [Saccharopolyspora aridisoli]TDC91290.1 cytochrome P450 [Saccharopolyspora aridisoli]
MMDEALPACPFPMPRDDAHRLDLPPEYRRLREEAPVCRVRTSAGDDAWVVSRYEDVRAALRDQRLSSRVAHPGYPKLFFPEPAPPGAFVQSDPPEHTRYRRMVIGQFTRKRAEDVRPYLQELVDARIDAMLAMDPPVDLVTEYAKEVPLSVICKLLGVPYRDRVAFGRWVNKLNEPTANPSVNKGAASSLFQYLRRLVTAKAKHPTDDLLGWLAGEHLAKGEITREEITAMAMMLLSAGYDTSASAISLSVMALLENPDEFARLRDDPDLINSAVEELLRHQNIMQWGVGRVAAEDVEIAGQRIPAGDGVILLLPSADRDDAAHPDADRLDITRETGISMSFGHGMHSCVGKFLTRVEMQVAIGTLVRRVPTLRLAKPPHELSYRDAAITYSVRELPVTW